MSAADGDFEDLLASVLRGDTAALDAADEKTLQRLGKALHPHSHVPRDERPEVRRALAASFTNLRETYIERFTVTALIGFLFRMHREWEVPDDACRWDPAAYGEKVVRSPALTAAELVARAEETLAAAKEAQEAEVEALAATQKAAEADVLRMEATLKGPTPEKAGASEQAEKDHALAVELGEKATSARGVADSLRYIAHRRAATHGEEARHALVAAGKIAAAHSKVADLVTKDPVRLAEATRTVPKAVAKEAIGQFLRTWFEYNPDAHVRSAHDEVRTRPAEEGEGPDGSGVDPADPGRLTLETLQAGMGSVPEGHKEAFAAATASHQTLAAVKTILATPSLGSTLAPILADTAASNSFRRYVAPVAEDDPARPALEIVPPQDTFHRFGYYRDVNYQSLRDITDTLYSEKSDIELAIMWSETFEGETQKEVDDAFAKYKALHSDELRSDLYSIPAGGWTLLGPWAENRDRIDIYNKNTKILERIMKRHEEDRQMGSELMRKRVVTAKAKNIQEAGPDHPDLGMHRSMVGSAGERVISPEKMRRIAAAKGDLAKVRELDDFAELDAERASLEKKKRFRPWTEEEAERVKELDRKIKDAKEMLDVPDAAIQVDILTHDGKTGDFVRSKFYTEAEAPSTDAGAPAAGAGMDSPGEAESKAPEV